MANKLHSNLPTASKRSNDSKNDIIKRKLDPKGLALFTIGMTDAADSITADDFDVMGEEINCQLQEIKNGNVELIELFLYSQSIALHHMFQHFFRSYLTSFEIEEKQIYGKLAFKAQSQSRKTFVALAEIKNPRKATFIKQQNNAINQQVNNSEKFPENFTKLSTELLREKQHETMGAGRAFEAVAINPPLEAVDAINGGANLRRKK